MVKDLKDENIDDIDLLRTNASLIVRDLSGKVFFWNSSAEQKYGWPQSKAIGNITHEFLGTVFPQPLDLINAELLNNGVWKGELIHTKVDGSRVKVQSTWKLYRDENGALCTVLEVNDNFFNVDPQTSYLDKKTSLRDRIIKIKNLLVKKKSWWLMPIVVVLTLLATFFAFFKPSTFFLEP